MQGQSAGTELQVVKHGIGGYQKGCRCEVCKSAKSEITRRYNQKHREARNEYNRTYNQKHAGRLKKLQAQWAAENRDKVRAKHKRWRDRNADKERLRVREWFEANPQYFETYYQNPEKVALRRARTALRRCRIKDATPVDVRKALLVAIYAACPNGYEVDHIVPIARGGKHSPENLQYLPENENRRKSHRADYKPKGVIPWQEVLPSTTIPRGSRVKRPEAHNTPKGAMI